MKHTVKVLVAFVALFLLSQILGMSLLSMSVQEIVNTPLGPEVVYTNTSIGERPDVQGYNVLLYVGIGVLVGTLLLLLIAKFNKVRFWKVWFLIAAWMTMSISLGVLFGERLYGLAWLLSAGLALVKINYPHPITHNLTEMLMYAGIAILLAPILSVPVAIVLLIAISIYDAYAVWKSKHMVKLAEFTKNSNLFPGLALAYTEVGSKTRIISTAKIHGNASAKNADDKSEKNSSKKSSKNKARIGILGGGDVIFPMLFSGAIFTDLVSKGYTSNSSLLLSLIISACAAIAIALLFAYGKKDRYYPAMPFITAGCLVGFLVIKIILFL